MCEPLVERTSATTSPMLCADAVSSAPCPCSALVLFGDDDAGSRDWRRKAATFESGTGAAGGEATMRRLARPACGVGLVGLDVCWRVRCGRERLSLDPSHHTRKRGIPLLGADCFSKRLPKIIEVGWTSPHYVRSLRPVLKKLYDSRAADCVL